MAAPFADPLFQALRQVELIDPWRLAARQVGMVGSSLLAGALVLRFEEQALICSSPLRYSRGNKGTSIAALDGEGVASLGYRASICHSEDADLMFPAPACRLTWSAEELRSRGLLGPAPPQMLLQRLAPYETGWAIGLRFLGAHWLHLTYRLDLDGAIEFAPVGSHHGAASITVESPGDEFGWLHPASAYPFALDDRCWPSAYPRDWPLPLRKALQSQPASGGYRDVMQRALLARFRQHGGLRRRLLAIRHNVAVRGVPAGLVEELAEQLRQEGPD